MTNSFLVVKFPAVPRLSPCGIACFTTGFAEFINLIIQIIYEKTACLVGLEPTLTEAL